MRLLLDTHTLLWAMLNKPQLSRRAASAIVSPSNEVFVSVVSIWEIATKVRIGKLDKPEDLLNDPRRTLLRLGFRDLTGQAEPCQAGRDARKLAQGSFRPPLGSAGIA